MELGLKLDDDTLFEKTEKKNDDNICQSHNLRNCYPLWFFDTATELDSPGVFITVKCQADYCYVEGQYEKALNHYMRCQEMLASKNVVWRDVEEAKARCFIHLGQQQNALYCAMNLAKLSMNFEQATCILHLLQKIYMQMGNTCEEERVLKKLLCLHPINTRLWIRLGKLYANECSSLLSDVGSFVSSASERTGDDQPKAELTNGSSCSPVCSVTTTLSAVDICAPSRLVGGACNDDDCCTGDDDELDSSTVCDHGKRSQLQNISSEMFKVLVCYLTARRLLKRLKHAVSFQKQANQTLLTKVQKQLDKINIPTTALQLCVKNVDRVLKQTDDDFQMVKDSNGGSTSDTLPTGLLEDGSDVIDAFDNRWFSWIYALRDALS